MASGRDREIAKAEPWKLEIEFCVAMGLQV
jgi:hypothetical protein